MEIGKSGLSLFLIILASTALLSCGGNSGSPVFALAISENPAAVTEVEIGPDGGGFNIILPDGTYLAEVIVPEGSLDENTLLGVAAYQTNRADLSYLFELTPAGVDFKKPLELILNCSYLIDESGFSVQDIGPYIITDENFLCPVYSFSLDTENESIKCRMRHFSSVILGPGTDHFGPADLIELAELLGAKLTPEMIAMLNLIFDTFSDAVDNPGNPDSLMTGSLAVKAWCDTHEDLRLAAGWIEDDYITGYQLSIVSDYTDKIPEPNAEGTFIYETYSAKGDVFIDADDYYLMMVNQCHSISVGSTVDGEQIFDIMIRQERSRPRLEITSIDSADLDQEETYRLEGRLFFNYTPFGQTETESKGIPEEILMLSLPDNLGILSTQTVRTDSNGVFSTLYTADWESSYEEPEKSDILVRFVHGNIELIEEVTINENRETLVLSTSPVHGEAYIPCDSEIEILFSEPMDLDYDDFYSIDPGVSFTRLWSEGQTKLCLIPDLPLDKEEEYTVNLDTGAHSQNGKTYAHPYIFSFTTAPGPFQVLGTSPLNGAIGVPIDTDIILEFNTPTDQGNVLENLSTFPSFDFNYQWDTPFLLRIMPLEEFEQKQYVSVGLQGTIENNSGETLDVPYYFAGFQTALVATEILSVSPKHQSTEIPLDTGIEIEFSRPMDPESLEQTLAITPSTGYDLLWDNSYSQCRMFFTEELDATTLYTLNVNQGVLDTNGEPLLTSYSFSFTTGEQNDDAAPIPAGSLSVVSLAEDNPYLFSSGDYLQFTPATDDVTPSESLEYCLVKSYYTIPDPEYALLLNEEISTWGNYSEPYFSLIPRFDTPGRTVSITLLVRDESGKTSMYPPINYTYSGSMELREIEADSLVVGHDPDHLNAGESNGIGISYSENRSNYFYMGIYAATQAEMISPSEYTAIHNGYSGTYTLSGSTLNIDVSEPISDSITEEAHYTYTIPLAGPYGMTMGFSGESGGIVGTYSMDNFTYLIEAGSIYRTGSISQTLILNEDGSFILQRTETGSYNQKSGTWYGYWYARQGGWTDNDNVVIALKARSKIDPDTGLHSKCYDVSGFPVQQIQVGGISCMQSTPNDSFINLFHGAESSLLYPQYFLW